MKAQRILAVVGLILIVVSIVTMIGGMFAGEAKGLVTLISLVCFLGAAGILLGLGAAKKQQPQEPSPDEPQE